MSGEEEFWQKSLENLELAQNTLAVCLQSVTENLDTLRSKGAGAYDCDGAQLVAARAGLFVIHLKDTLDRCKQISDAVAGRRP